MADVLPIGTAWDPEFFKRSGMFAPLLKAAQHFRHCERWPELADYNAMARALNLRNATGLGLVFAAARPKPRGSRRRQAAQLTQLSYEAQVYQNGEVPTRLGSWHDFFNALVWGTYPLAKAALNHRQITAATSTTARVREQDRLAMFDEGGIIRLQGQPANAADLVFGHALFEAYMHGQMAVYGMAYPLLHNESPPSSGSLIKLSLIDAELARHIHSGLLWDPMQRPPRSLLSDLKFTYIIG